VTRSTERRVAIGWRAARDEKKENPAEAGFQTNALFEWIASYAYCSKVVERHSLKFDGELLRSVRSSA
jgi:hypothetical protein